MTSVREKAPSSNLARDRAGEEQAGARERIRQKILVVEDESDIRELIRYNLNQEGFAVEEAVDGAEAFDRIERRAPDLVLLDLMLPRMPGLELCRRLRARPE